MIKNMKPTVSRTQRVLNVWAIVLILWSIYRTKLVLPEWFDELVAKPFVFITPVYVYLTHVEKTSFFKGIGLTIKDFFSEVKVAVLIGLFFTIAGFAAHYVKNGGFSFAQTLLGQNPQSLLLIFVLALATATCEEILSRGFVLKRLYEESNNMFTSSFLASVLFLIIHIPILFTNLKLSGSQLLLFMTTDFILSLINSFIFLDRKNLIAPILIHALYNMSILLYA